MIRPLLVSACLAACSDGQPNSTQRLAKPRADAGAAGFQLDASSAPGDCKMVVELACSSGRTGTTVTAGVRRAANSACSAALGPYLHGYCDTVCIYNAPAGTAVTKCEEAETLVGTGTTPDPGDASIRQ